MNPLPRKLVGILLIPLIGALCSCSQPDPLRVGVHPWIGYETLSLADGFGWLPETVDLRPGAAMSDSTQALAAGALDAAALTLDAMLLVRAAGVPVTAVLVFDVSAGADMLLAREAYSTIASLRHRRVAVEPSALGPLLLARALRRAGLSLDDVELHELTPDAQLEAWREGRIDAAVAYGPTASQLKRLGARRLFDSRELPDTIVDVLAVRQDRLGHPALAALVGAHFRTLDYLRRNREDALYRIAERHALSYQMVNRQLSGIVLPDVTRNLADLRARGPLVQGAKELNQLMVAQGLLAAPVALDHLVDARFVELQLKVRP